MALYSATISLPFFFFFPIEGKTDLLTLQLENESKNHIAFRWDTDSESSCLYSMDVITPTRGGWNSIVNNSCIRSHSSINSSSPTSKDFCPIFTFVIN